METEENVRKSLREALIDHSYEGLAVLSDEPSRLMRAMVLVMFTLLLVAVAWSFFGKANVIVTAQGKFIPEGEVRRVYSPLDGEIVDVAMQEGMPVSKGDVLVRVNAMGAVEATMRATDAKMKLKDAEAKYRLFPSEKEGIEKRLELIKSQIEAEKKMHEKEVVEGMSKLSEEYKLKLEKARTKLDKARQEMERARLVLEQHERLFQSPGGGGIAKDKINEKRGEFQAKSTEFKLAEAALGEFEIELNKDFAKKQEDIQKKYENVVAFQAQYQENLLRLEQAEQRAETDLKMARTQAESISRFAVEDLDENAFLRIRAPESGVLTEVATTQRGDKVDSKKPIAGIAPQGSRKVLELLIDERDRGFLREGMPVKIKVNAFPYERYGVLTGSLEFISPNAVMDPDSKKYFYKGRASVEQERVAVGDSQFDLRYGMTVTAEIIVRARRIIDVAIDPLRKVAG
jgi:HlyD family secretion protein